MKALKRILLGLGLLLIWGTAYAQPDREWKAYKERFLTGDGRVIDFIQGRASHSEGQGYGLLLAAIHDEPQTFSSLWKWTQDNLRMRKGDSLHAWKWGRRPGGQWAVLDYNNATDGDLLIAWALLKGAEKWKNETYRTQAREIIKSIRENLIVQRRGKLYVLPGYYGFTLKEGEVLNPSYLIFSAFKKFEQTEEPKFWKKVREDSLEAFAILTGMGPTYIWFQLVELMRHAETFGLGAKEAEEATYQMVAGAAKTLHESGLSAEDVIDLIPVKPLAEDEETIRAIYRTKLPALYRKLKR